MESSRVKPNGRLYFSNCSAASLARNSGLQVFGIIAKALYVHFHTVTVTPVETLFRDLQAEHLSTIINFEAYQFDFFLSSF